MYGFNKGKKSSIRRIFFQLTRSHISLSLTHFTYTLHIHSVWRLRSHCIHIFFPSIVAMVVFFSSIMTIVMTMNDLRTSFPIGNHFSEGTHPAQLSHRIIELEWVNVDGFIGLFDMNIYWFNLHHERLLICLLQSFCMCCTSIHWNNTPRTGHLIPVNAIIAIPGRKPGHATMLIRYNVAHRVDGLQFPTCQTLSFLVVLSLQKRK